MPVFKKDPKRVLVIRKLQDCRSWLRRSLSCCKPLAIIEDKQEHAVLMGITNLDMRVDNCSPTGPFVF